jgi:hypothetical protein
MDLRCIFGVGNELTDERLGAARARADTTERE